MSKKVFAVLSLLVVLAMVLAGCGATPEPEKIIETVVVEKEKTVVETVEVEKEVIKEVEKEVQVAGEVKNVVVWAQAAAVEHWRADAPMKAAILVNQMFEEQGNPMRVTVEGLNDDAGWADYKKKFTLAADAGEGPHVIVSGHEDVPVWANAGYIVSFQECRDMYPEFDDVIDGLWFAGEWAGDLWAVPQDTEARPMFFSKTKLAELGWTQEQIDGLPKAIANGEFTLEDMIETAKEAIAKGVVEPGYGYWHRSSKGGDFIQYYYAYGGDLYDPEQDKLIIDQEALEDFYAFQRRVVAEGITPENFIGTDSSIWHDTVTHEKVLFWNGGVWHWAQWVTNYAKEAGGEPYLFETVGYAVQPAGETERGRAGQMSHPLVYMITSEEAAGDEGFYEAACAVLAKTCTPEIATLHSVDSTHLGILKSQADYPQYAENRFLSETLYMLDYAFYQPNHVMYGPWYDIVYDYMVKSANGEMAPADAAVAAVAQLQSELGDALIVR